MTQSTDARQFVDADNPHRIPNYTQITSLYMVIIKHDALVFCISYAAIPYTNCSVLSTQLIALDYYHKDTIRQTSMNSYRYSYRYSINIC